MGPRKSKTRTRPETCPKSPAGGKLLEAARKAIRRLADPVKAATLRRFFKTGKEEYGEGDIFLGVVVPRLRMLAGQFGDMDLVDAAALLESPIHEERLLALLILVSRFERSDPVARRQIFKLYLAKTDRINNWDLVDLSAPQIVGAHLEDGDLETLVRLARSKHLWERRIAIVATYHFIKKGDPRPTLAVAGRLLRDEHDLIHKAVGWMLREVGKRCGQNVEEEFLRTRYRTMPRTMLRYAIERFPEKRRQAYLKGTA